MKTLFAWDFHGVLEKDNVYAVQDTCNRVLAELDIPRRITLEETIKLYGKNWINYFIYLCPDSTKEEIWQMREKAIEVGMKKMKGIVKPMDYSVEVLNKIKKNGNSNIVLSNARPEDIEDFLETTGFIPLLDYYTGVPKEKESEDLCIATYKGKVLSEYAKTNGFSRKFMIGDNESDVKAGKIAGATTFRFVNKYLLPEDEIIDDAVKRIRKESKADYVITDLRDVLKYGPMV